MKSSSGSISSSKNRLTEGVKSSRSQSKSSSSSRASSASTSSSSSSFSDSFPIERNTSLSTDAPHSLSSSPHGVTTSDVLSLAQTNTSVYAVTAQSLSTAQVHAAQQEGVRYSHAMLDMLENMQHDLLGANAQPLQINDVNAQLQKDPADLDPRLQSIVDDIRVRAAVECAKRNAS